MSNQAPWPVRKGIFRSTGQSDFVPTRTPSPIVEMPMSPSPKKTLNNPLNLSVTIPETTTTPLSPPPPPTPTQQIQSKSQPTSVKAIRPITIAEV